MKTGWSEKVREVADRDYVQPSRRKSSYVRISFGELHTKMQQQGFPPQHPNQIATALESKKFWEPRGLVMCSPKGQSRKNETVFEFKFVDDSQPARKTSPEHDPLLGLAGILKGTIREGAPAFIREIRRDKGTGL
ncbi:MAG: hypothetical protein JWM43_1009 [Acidobacteriaceae bacterium]|nr:hypothetical protein [Acidobacteriaceae bacterium]